MKRTAGILALVLAVATGCGNGRSSDRCSVPIRVDYGSETARDGRFAGTLDLLEASAEQHVFPGAVLVVGHAGTIVLTAAVGCYGDDDTRPVTDSTIYDLASVTKVVALTTAAMILVDEGKLDLDRLVQEFLPEFRGPDKDRVSVRHLLTHTSGLPAWRPLHLETATREEAIDSVLSARLETPPGSKYIYSDFGAITLTLIVEKVTGEPLDTFVERRVYRPLGMDWTRYRPPAEWIERIAPTENDPWRGFVVRGEVHDENTVRLGGVSGHAGLFSIAPDLARFADWLLDEYHGRVESSAEPHVRPETVRDFVTRQPGPDGATRALGWDTPSEGGAGGTLMAPTSFGHTGFTGTSIWIDPERELYVILLSNRVHPSRDNQEIYRVRGEVADSVVVAIGRAAGSGNGGEPRH